MARDKVIGPALSAYFDQNTLKKLNDRWLRKHESGPDFWSGVADFWSENLRSDFKISPGDLALLSDDRRNIYVKLYRLEGLKMGALLQVHTKLFIENSSVKVTLLSVADDNLELFKGAVSRAGYDRDALKEFQIIAAFFASQKILDYLDKEHGFSIDSGVLNMVVLSGSFTGEALRGFTLKCAPTFDSIRYAIKSLNVALVGELFAVYGLKPTSDHLVAAAATGKSEMFDFLLSTGVRPHGQFVLKAAVGANSSAIIDKLVNEFGYERSDHTASVALG